MPLTSHFPVRQVPNQEIASAAVRQVRVLTMGKHTGTIAFVEFDGAVYEYLKSAVVEDSPALPQICSVRDSTPSST